MCKMRLFLSLVVCKDCARNCIPRVVPKILVYSHAKMCQGQCDLQTVEITCFTGVVPANLHEMLRCLGRGFLSLVVRKDLAVNFFYSACGAKNISVLPCQNVSRSNVTCKL
jgi:hypothetical protein